MPMDYGRVRLWGSIAFVIGSALVGKLVSLYDYQAILALLSVGIASMLLGMLLRPSVMPQGESRHQERAGWPAWKVLIGQSWRFLACVCLLQGAHAAYYGFSAIYWHGAGYSASAIGYLWSLGVVAEVVIFALSKKLFRRFGARDLLLLSAVCGVARWGIMGWTTELPWLIVAQILHCGTFTVCHLAAMRYISAREGSDVIRLPGDLFRRGDGRQYRRDDGFCGLFVPASRSRRVLGDGAGCVARDGCATESGRTQLSVTIPASREYALAAACSMPLRHESAAVRTAAERWRKG